MAFWNRARDALGKAAEEAQKQATIASLNLQIGGVRGDVTRKQTEIGQKVVELHKQGALTQQELFLFCTEIDALAAKIGELEQRIAEARAN